MTALGHRPATMPKLRAARVGNSKHLQQNNTQLGGRLADSTAVEAGRRARLLDDATAPRRRVQGGAPPCLFSGTVYPKRTGLKQRMNHSEMSTSQAENRQGGERRTLSESPLHSKSLVGKHLQKIPQNIAPIRDDDGITNAFAYDHANGARKSPAGAGLGSYAAGKKIPRRAATPRGTHADLPARPYFRWHHRVRCLSRT